MQQSLKESKGMKVKVCKREFLSKRHHTIDKTAAMLCYINAVTPLTHIPINIPTQIQISIGARSEREVKVRRWSSGRMCYY